MNAHPAASVLTCVYNGERLLGQAIESVLGQSQSDFEYLIVDDGSQDNSYAVACRYAAQDERIVLLRNDTNLGISRALNRGIAATKGEVIMILDHDDRAHPQRLAQQSRLLMAQREIGVAGCHLEVVDVDGVTAGVYRPPAESLRLRWELLFRCAIPMGAACFRRQSLLQSGGLSAAFGISGDYDLLTRLALSTQLAVVPEILLYYRSHPAQNTRVKADRTHWEAMIAACTWWRNWLGLNANLGDVGLVYRSVNGRGVANQGEAERAIALIEELHRRFLGREMPESEDRAYLGASVARKVAAIQTMTG